MKTISIMKNTIQAYAWGSYTAIPDLLGKASSDNPQAELWMGAHTKAPSQVEYDGKQVSLAELIKKNPGDILGKAAAEKFDNELPYLFKVLAAAKPLSIQAHPSREQAKAGFERENRLDIPLDAPHRNYKDSNHKPECICALTPFWALNGFRRISEILPLIKKVCPRQLEEGSDILMSNPGSEGLKQFFQTIMTMNPGRQKDIISNAVDNAKKYSDHDPVFRWITELYKAYPSDIGVLSPVFLNLICLEPGQAMFLPAGELHSYLGGTGIELMANSDNVLRGGLTPKHLDVPELLQVLNFEERDIKVLLPRKISEYESVYPGSAEEFVLSLVSVTEHTAPANFLNRSVEILLCTGGSAEIRDISNDHTIMTDKGTSVIIPAVTDKYSISGNAVFYKASVPLISE
ncbi:mannose-6-phosphate isomerase, class I [Desulfococcaceae bacterium HSG8]|nr:mannose-6-phosphate isomerase, class I [Desulfococcaceae bacterium HSG8]